MIKLQWVVVIVIGVAALFGCASSKGEPTEEAVVRSFLAALTANDLKALTSLVHPDFSGQPELSYYRNNFGGSRFESVQIKIEHNTVANYLADAYVKGYLSNPPEGTSPKTFEFHLRLRKADKRWFLVTGNPRVKGVPENAPKTIPRP